MRIAYVGNFIPPHSTENHVAGTLEDMGHEVVRIQELTGDRLNRGLVDRADLFLWTRTWAGFVMDDDLDWLRYQGIPSASYHLDLYVGLVRQAQINEETFWHTDHVFTADGDPKSAEIFKRLGINHHWLPAAVYKAEAEPGIFQPYLASDIAFVGTYIKYHPEWPYRPELVAWLKRKFPDQVKIYGEFPNRGIRGSELNSLYASAKVVIGDSLCPNFTHSNYWSDRVYETIGRGGFIIHPQIPGLDSQFKESELLTYQFGNFDQLETVIKSMLICPEQRERIRLAGYQRVLKDHTYHQRMETLLATVYAGTRVSAFM